MILSTHQISANAINAAASTTAHSVHIEEQGKNKNSSFTEYALSSQLYENQDSISDNM